MLRACHDALRPGGRLAFLTILISADAHGAARSEARRAGPPAVATRMSYPMMLKAAGFTQTWVTDLTEEFERTSAAWFSGTERYGDELTQAYGAPEYLRMLRERRVHLEAVRAGLLTRVMFVAAKWARGGTEAS